MGGVGAEGLIQTDRKSVGRESGARNAGRGVESDRRTGASVKRGNTPKMCAYRELPLITVGTVGRSVNRSGPL